MTSESVFPRRDEVSVILRELRAGRDRLAALAPGQGDESDTASLAAAVDLIGEQLLVADEELRVQTEHLEESSHQLEALVTAYEQLFANAPVAYVHTDADGVILRVNRAATRLIDTGPHRPRTLLAAVRPADRSAVRCLLSRLRRADAGEAPEPIEVALVGRDGRERPVFLSARRSTDVESGGPAFHWEVQHRAGGPSSRAGTPEIVRRDGAPLFRVMADVAADLAREDDPARTLEQVVAKACTAVPHCEEAGVTIVRSRGRVETPAATGDLAAACDQLQHKLHEGPCLQAVRDCAPVHVPDLARDTRWPRFSRAAAQVGPRSMVAVPLTGQRGTVGSLNLYARTPDAFGDDDLVIAQAYAMHAAIALTHAELEANLRIGLRTREEIGRAVGILMERHRLTAPAAFDILVVASQQTHRKLRDIAVWVNETGEDPVTVAAAEPAR